MHLHTQGFATSAGDPDREGLAYAYCVSDTGYCLSLSRFSDSEFVEIMVADQIVHRTAELEVGLFRDRLKVRLSSDDAAALDSVGEYVVQFSMSGEETDALDTALKTIFACPTLGKYSLGMIKII